MTKTKKNRRGRKAGSPSTREALLARFERIEAELTAMGCDVDQVLEEAAQCDVQCADPLASLGLRGGGL